MEPPEFYRKLIKGYKDRTSTDVELEVLMHLIRQGKLDEYLIESMDEEAAIVEDAPGAVSPGEVLLSRRSGILKWLPYAAACLLLASLGTVLYNSYFAPVEKAGLTETLDDIPPGGNHATLTLENGSVITLDQLVDGEVVEQGGLTIRKTGDGQLVYEAGVAGTAEGAPAYNTITTPNGGQYRVILPDGSHVWLNAASSLRYPVRFNAATRQVELTGEGYFEVSANESAPFVVACPDQVVRVTGTHFNINAYPEEQSVHTTLLEGRVVVASNDGKNSASLKPGEQASLANEKLTVKAVDTDRATDWKSGDFIFENEDIGSIMRRVARWYDVNIVYEKGYQPGTGFFGQVSRSKNISEVLQVLELTGAVRFRVAGRTITVLPADKKR